MPTDSRLLSPPRNWPASFKGAPLKKLVGQRGLNGVRCRLTHVTPPAILTEAAAVEVDHDSMATANRVHAELNWPVIKGFVLFEREDTPDAFVAEPHSWNMHPTNVWVDLTPRAAQHEQMVLLESAATPQVAAVVSASSASAGASVSPAATFMAEDAVSGFQAPLPPVMAKRQAQEPQEPPPPAGRPSSGPGTWSTERNPTLGPRPPPGGVHPIIGLWTSRQCMRKVPVAKYARHSRHIAAFPIGAHRTLAS